jgi:hypothetical protein
VVKRPLTGRTREREGISVKHTIFGVHISHRTENVPAVQAVLSKYGCSIRTRLGLHDADSTSCSPSGLLLVDVFGPEAEPFYMELSNLQGVDLQRMDFEE